MPKKPKSAFFMFNLERLNNYKNDHPDEKNNII